MNPVPRRSRLLSIGSAALALSAALVVAACGPTATAIRPTLPPRTLSPDLSETFPLRTPSGITNSSGPETSQTPPPPGIAQPIANFPQGSAYEVDNVTATPSGGFVAVGYQTTGQDGDGPDQGVVWTSADGLTWQEQVDPAFVGVDPSYVVAMGTDVYVFGYDYADCPDTEDGCGLTSAYGNVIFRSSNGGPWEQLAQISEIQNAEFDGVIVWNNTLVAWGAGADDNSTTTIWTSTDGLSWTPATNLAGIDTLDSVGAGGPGLVAFGSKYEASSDVLQLLAATSSDGSNWAAATVPQMTDTSITRLTAGPGGMAGIGDTENDQSATVGVTVYSTDGLTWTQSADDSSFATTQLNDLHASSTTYVAVGSTISDADLALQTGAVWVSGDGNTWRSLGNFGGSFTQYGGSALAPSGMVMFTANEADSPDGTSVTSTIYGWFLPASQLTP